MENSSRKRKVSDSTRDIDRNKKVSQKYNYSSISDLENDESSIEEYLRNRTPSGTIITPKVEDIRTFFSKSSKIKDC